MNEPLNPQEPKIVHVLFAICLVASLALLYTRSQQPEMGQFELLRTYWYLPLVATVSLVGGVYLRLKFRDSQKKK